MAYTGSPGINDTNKNVKIEMIIKIKIICPVRFTM